MNALELFSGTKSFGKVFANHGTAISLDICDKHSPTICADILSWDYTQYPPKYFAVVWASPPCTEYSTCLTTRPRNFELADSIVKRVLEIIKYFQPGYWYIENPYTGLMKTRPMMQGIEYKVVDYCAYGFEYRKRTAIWTNNSDWCPLPLCRKNCKNIETTESGRKRHRGRIGFGSTMFSRDQRYRVPAALIQEILESHSNL